MAEGEMTEADREYNSGFFHGALTCFLLVLLGALVGLVMF